MLRAFRMELKNMAKEILFQSYRYFTLILGETLLRIENQTNRPTDRTSRDILPGF